MGDENAKRNNSNNGAPVSGRSAAANGGVSKKEKLMPLMVLIAVISVLAFVLTVINNLDLIRGPIGIGGGDDAGGGGKIENSKMKKFSSSDELKKFLDEGANRSYWMMNGGVFGTSSMMNKSMGIPEPSGTPMPRWSEKDSSEGSVGIGGGDYSTTNVQVAGVDESDTVKTDGDYIYTISNNVVSIVNAYPADKMELVSKIEFDSAPMGMYLNGDRLAVYGQEWNIQAKKKLGEIIIPPGRMNFAYFKIYDISNKGEPKEIRNIYFEGSSASSRMIGDYVYFVTSSSPYSYYGYAEPGVTEDMIAPLVIDRGKILNGGGKDISCKGCQNVYYFDFPYNSYLYTTISSVNIKSADEEVKSDVFLLDQSQNNIYVSETNIYVTYTKYVSEEMLTMDVAMELMKEYVYPELSSSDRDAIEEIENAKNYVLSPEEKYEKIGRIIQKYQKKFEGRIEEMEQEFKKRIEKKFGDISKELEKTVIHKIAIDKGDLKYSTFGEVTGKVLNQFSMDENANYFRIATTKNRTWSSFAPESSESHSNLYVLDDGMNVVGKVEGIAKGEQIYSVRFMQNRAYMVTFRRTDPLFAIDLADPNNPRILGELKVPGFSSYLHPYDDKTLIGLGKESDENGSITGGVKLSLFDVSDVGNPKELDKYVIGDRSSDSLAINDSKAFLFSKEKNLLVIPVTEKNMSPIVESQGISLDRKTEMLPMPGPVPPIYQKYFNGAYVFGIDDFKFKLKGKIDHSPENADISQMFVEGKFGKALKFNGVDDYASVSSENSFDPASSITLSAWIKPSVINWNQVIISKYYSPSAVGPFYLLISGNEIVAYFAKDWNSNYIQEKTTTADLQPDVWYNIVATYTLGSDDIKIYINGKEDISGASALTGKVDSLQKGYAPIYFGALYTAQGLSTHFNGTIDDVRVYNRALSSKEIKSIYGNSSVDSSGLAGWWKFDEVNEVQLSDSSGNGKNALIKDYVSSYDYDSLRQIKRSLYIKDVLYTISNGYIGANNLSDLAGIKKITLPQGSTRVSIPMWE